MNKLFQWLLKLFSPSSPSPEASGLLFENPEDIENMPSHSLIFGATSLTRDWTPDCPPYRWQGASLCCTAFAGTNARSCLEHSEGKTVLFSPYELFFRSGGGILGNYVSKTCDAMQNAVVLESDVPTPAVTKWGYDGFTETKDKTKASLEILARSSTYKIKSRARVEPTHVGIRAALLQSPVMVTIPVGPGYFLPTVPYPPVFHTYHEAVCVKVEDDGRFKILDSLEDSKDFQGFRWLAPNYPIMSATSLIDLPSDWQSKQIVAVNNTFGNALNHYGKPRDLKLEQTNATTLHNAITLQNQQVMGLIGADWTVNVNAISYGGFTVQDILNQYFAIHRGMTPPFNLNQPK